MSASDIFGGVICFLLLIVVIVLAILINTENSTLNQCNNDQSPYCLTVQCPCDGAAVGVATPPCNGYAKRPGPNPNTYYCSYAPNTLVDQNGIPV
jgi:hypothetical protein